MTPSASNQHRSILQKIAREEMQARGLASAFSPAAQAELKAITGPGQDPTVQDLRERPWCSLDNDDSRDLDQLTQAEAQPGGAILVRVAIADVDALVKRGTALDQHAQQNTTSVYTAAELFPMLPERLSTDLTSLNPQEDRLACVVAMTFGADGALQASELVRATVRNQAKLAYNSIAQWLEENGPLPPAAAGVAGLETSLRLQHQLTQNLKSLRQAHGALDFQTIQARPVFAGEELQDLRAEAGNSAKELIEELMVAANGVTARFLASKGHASLRRVVRVPKRWDRIVALAAEHGTELPKEPESKALDQFLVAARAADPLRFPDLSLSVIKLLGAGEYAVNRPGAAAVGHFGLALQDYTHATAPNRRFPDLINQRLLKSALAGRSQPYGPEELEALARHCTQGEDAARKVERKVTKAAAAILLEARIGETFEAIVTGASEKGTWVRLLNPPVEGRLASGFEGLEVGTRLQVRLVSTVVERGFIDFQRVT